ncbi:MAG: hypothetical protein ABJ327_21080, partial [Litoreibacter sp.]
FIRTHDIFRECKNIHLMMWSFYLHLWRVPKIMDNRLLYLLGQGVLFRLAYPLRLPFLQRFAKVLIMSHKFQNCQRVTEPIADFPSVADDENKLNVLPGLRKQLDTLDDHPAKNDASLTATMHLLKDDHKKVLKLAADHEKIDDSVKLAVLETLRLRREMPISLTRIVMF